MTKKKRVEVEPGQYKTMRQVVSKAVIEEQGKSQAKLADAFELMKILKRLIKKDESIANVAIDYFGFEQPLF